MTRHSPFWFMHKEFTDTTLLFNIEIKLAIAGITFKLEECIFLMGMEKFSDRYQFDEWKSIFNQVFEASQEGTAVEVIRAAMAECGIVEPSSDISHIILSPQAPSSQTHKPMFTLGFGSLTNHSIKQKLTQIPLLSTPSKASKNEHEDEEDKEEDKEDELDNKVDCCPRVTTIAPSGHMNLTQQLKSLFHHYGGEGSAEGSRVKVHQQGPVCNVKDHMEVNMNQTQPRVFKVMLPSGLIPSNPWVTTPNDVNAQHCRCMSWLFDNDFCNFSKWHVCLRVRLAYNHGTLGKQVVHTTIPDHFFSEKHGVVPPGHVLATVTSSTNGQFAYNYNNEGGALPIIILHAAWVAASFQYHY
ncbi:hypothetical protein F5J12DRAFT_786397 [Pisolithus orientalis]|uniref:uncharacterized protein n=1 Tax=Pisolithus orientalis TaxID=936130 RepID=UPI0022248CE5|nr:uncharacterized protein F5J12DRAFT_786397 [Pisolithus orientalis]KAI5991061.1 hypothetical protein F5J12DRAFT_786397 [Pisolithus orientalis]